MAFFVPIAASIGAATGVSTGAVLAGTALGATALTVGMGAKAQYDAGQMAKAEYKLEAKQAADAARAREIERKRALISAISSQHARSGALGVAMQGSNVAMVRRDIEDARQDLLYDTVSTRTRQRVLRSRGQNASYQGGIGAITSIADGALNTYQAYG